MNDRQHPTRLCRTAADCFQAGWDDGATDKPLTQAEIDRLVVLLSPPTRQAAAVELAERRSP